MLPICGIIPAAGGASRIQPLPCSKEIFPVGFSRRTEAKGAEGLRPRVVADYLLERMRAGGARQVYLILGQGKWDIPAYFGSGQDQGLALAYLLTESPYGAPYSVRQALPFVDDARVLFGFPDIVFEPEDAFQRLLAHQRSVEADVTLGLFPAIDPSKMDMVELDAQQRVCRINIKPNHSTLDYTWLIATWTQAFSNYMQTFLQREETFVRERYAQAAGNRQAEYYMGHVLQAALADGLHVSPVCFDAGTYIDIGTPGDLHLAVNTAVLKGD